MSLVIILGKYISVQILTEWVPREGLVSLDSALCNKATRKVYHGWMWEYENLFISHLVNRSISIRYIGNIGRWAENRGFDASKIIRHVYVDGKTLGLFSKDLALAENCLRFAGLMKTLDFQIHNHDYDHALVYDKILSKSVNLEGLQLRRGPYWMYSTIASLYTNLIAIDFSGCDDKIRESSLVNVLRNNPRLTDVNVNLCQVTHPFAHALIVHGRNIRRLNLLYCSVLTSKSRLRLALHSHFDLESLGVNTFQPFEMECLLQYQKVYNLQQVNFHASRVPYLNRACPNIVSLNLRECGGFSDKTLARICSLNKLEYCNLEFILTLKSSVFMQIASSCHALHTLLLYKTDSTFNCDDLALLGVVCPTLRTLALVKVVSLTSNALLKILQHGQKFQRLNVSQNLQLTDSVFIEGAKFLVSIEVLDLTECRCLTSLTLKALLKCKKLVEVHCKSFGKIIKGTIATMQEHGIVCHCK